VRRAIAAVEDALRAFGPPVYVRHAIVHNAEVVRALEAQGAIFVEELDDVPDNSVVIFSAHGTPPFVAREAERRGLTTYDAVCPLVAKVHREVVRHHRAGRHILLIGHSGHPEIAGTLTQVPTGAVSIVATLGDIAALTLPSTTPCAYAVQTTFSVGDADQLIRGLRARFPLLEAPPASDICYATTNRQAALRAIAPQADAVIVVGAAFSSNANRLAEVAGAAGCGQVQLVSGPEGLDWQAILRARTIGMTAAASTPESSVTAVLEALRARLVLTVEEVTSVTETTSFRALPVARPRR